MSDDDLLDDLLLRWEELHDRGRDVTAEELCPERPDLAGLLTERIVALKAVAWVKEPVEDEPDPVLVVPDASDSPRTLAGRYRLDGLLGEGGFAQVWKGFDLELQRPVAVKVPRASRILTPEEVERFVAEARRVAQLRHPGVVAVHDIYRSGAGYFFVTDLIDGCDLASRLRRGRLPQGEAVRLVAEVARILAYAHGRGFVHLDIKPHNILLDDKGHPLVCDFGIAATEQELLRGDMVKATLAYASPEQVGGRPIDARSDIWSLGVVLYEMLTGRLPFDAPGPVALREQIISAEPPALRTADATISPGLEKVCLKCLAKTPADRFASAQALADELTALVRPPKSSGYRLVALVAGLLGILIVVVLAVTYRPRTTPIADPEATRAGDDELPATEALRSFQGHSGPVLCVAFGPDGRTVASGSADATVRIRPVEGGNEGVVLKQVTGCTALAYTADGKTLACGCENGTVRLWDLAGASPKECLVLPGHAGRVTCVTFSPDGKFLVTGGKDGTVRILDRRAEKPRAAVIPKAGGVVLWTGFSAGGKLLVGYGDGPDKPGEFLLWELTTRLALRQRAPLAGLHDLRSLRISSAGTLILAAAGSQVYVWRKEPGKDSFGVTGSFPLPATCVALSPGERLALSGSPHGLRLWDVEAMREKARLVGHAGGVESVAFSPGGNLAASGGADGSVRLWPTGEPKAAEAGSP